MTDPLWTYDELCSLFDCVGDTGSASDVTGVSIDTRTLQAGDLFVALDAREDGTALGRDGHDFAGKAQSAGAAAVMTHKPLDLALPQLSVEDTHAGLTQLGLAARQRHQGRAIAITGSSGKTTLRVWLETLLAFFGSPHASAGSYNNHWGVPLSLARMPAASEFGVFEVGTNHPGEIAPLSRLVAPDIAVLLNVLPAHIGNFPDMQALTREKLSIADGLRSGGLLVLPASLADLAPGQVDLLTFGAGGDVDGDIKPSAAGARVSLKTSGKASGASLDLQIPFQGEHRLQSVLAAVAVLRALNLDPLAAAQLFSELPLPDGRGKTEVINGIILIDDSYNANPASMKHAVNTLKAVKPTGRCLALLGEMQELGEAGRRAHLDIAEHCQQLDGVYSFGKGFADVDFGANHLGHSGDVDQFDLAAFCKTLDAGDRVLVKGSNQVFWVNGFAEKLRQALSRL